DYNFQQDTAYGPDRFELIVALSSVSAEEHNRILSSDPFAYKGKANSLIINYGDLAGAFVEMQLVNINGQVVWHHGEQTSQSHESGRFQQELTPGMYILSLKDNEGRSYQQKVMW
ncbi:MAG: T9SS type A sorting domain-containing protein, partial [Bacteroidetes bacterium]